MRHLRIKSLPTGWTDRDEIMLHACFQILTDCVEKENVDTHCSYETHKDFVDEVRFLYQWWLDRKEISDIDDEMLLRLIKIRKQLWT